MERLKIQLFGGRGTRSGLGVGGPGIGIATGIDLRSGKGKDLYLEVHPEYPDFPDPDYSDYKLKTKDNFIKNTFDLFDYKRKNHDITAQKYIKSLNINPDVQYSNYNDDLSFGYVYSHVDPFTNKIQVLKVNLNKADTRRMEYKVKTMIHEGYHACNDGLASEELGMSRQKYVFHEETRTEMTALYLANKLNGYTYVPSYSLEVVSAAAKYVRTEEYKNCKTLNDLGERFYNDRMVNRKNPSYKQIEKDFRKVYLDDNYYKKYYNRIVANRDNYYEVCKNSLFNWEYFNGEYEKTYKKSFDSMIEKISVNKKFTFTGREEQLFIQCVALSMNDGGIL